MERYHLALSLTGLCDSSDGESGPGLFCDSQKPGRSPCKYFLGWPVLIFPISWGPQTFCLLSFPSPSLPRVRKCLIQWPLLSLPWTSPELYFLSQVNHFARKMIHLTLYNTVGNHSYRHGRGRRCVYKLPHSDGLDPVKYVRIPVILHRFWTSMTVHDSHHQVKQRCQRHH